MPIYQIISGIIKQWTQHVCSFFINAAELFVYLYTYRQLAICMFFYSKNLNFFASARPPAHPIFEGKTDANQTIN